MGPDGPLIYGSFLFYPVTACGCRLLIGLNVCLGVAVVTWDGEAVVLALFLVVSSFRQSSEGYYEGYLGILQYPTAVLLQWKVCMFWYDNCFSQN